jgi:hypothetical protein
VGRDRSTGPLLVAGRLLLAQDEVLTAFEPLTGSEVWSVNLGAGGDAGFAALTARSDVAYAFRGG